MKGEGEMIAEDRRQKTEDRRRETVGSYQRSGRKKGDRQIILKKGKTDVSHRDHRERGEKQNAERKGTGK